MYSPAPPTPTSTSSLTNDPSDTPSRLSGQGLARRIPAGLIDTALVLGLMTGLIAMGTRLTAVRPVTTLLAAAMCLLYFVFFEAYWSTTPGKRAFRLAVVKADGGRPDPLEHLLRAMTRVPEALLVLPYVISVVQSPQNQRLGDRVTETLVVRVPRTRAHR